MSRVFAIASLAMLGASPMPKVAALVSVPAIAAAPIERAVFQSGSSARDAMNESVARMATHAATPGANGASLSQRERLALLVLLSLHRNSGTAEH